MAAMIRRPRLALVASTLSLAACASHNPDVRAVHRGVDERTVSAFDQAYEGGKAQLKSNHVGLALVLFEKALAIDSNSVAALNAVGTAYDELHFPQIAARYYARALALEPKSADTLNNMALSARIAGKPDEARLLFERALQADAANRTIHANRDAIDAPVQTAAAAASEEDAPADVPVVERVGQNAFELVLPGRTPVPVHATSVEPLPPPAAPVHAELTPTAVPILAISVDPLPPAAAPVQAELTPTAVPILAISVEPLPPPATPVYAELNPREQAVRARMAAFFTAREERRRFATSETTIAVSTTVASAGDTPIRRVSAERAWFNLFRVFFEQREARHPAEDRKDASTRPARNG